MECDWLQNVWRKSDVTWGRSLIVIFCMYHVWGHWLGYKVMNQFPQSFNQSDLMNNSRASLTSVQTLFSSVDLCSVLHLGHWSGCVCTSYSLNRGNSESKDVTFKTLMVSHCIVLSLDLLLLPGCKEEVAPEHQERSSSLVQEEPGPPQIKEEHEEEADVSTVTSLHWDTRCDCLSGKTMLNLQ